MEWITGNMRELFEIAIAIHGLAVLVVNLTPTPKDDEAVSKAYRMIEILGGIVSPLAKR